MGSTWLKNFCGFRPNEFEMLQVPYPGLEYGIHVTIRTSQMGAIIGSILGPLSAAFMHNETKPANLMNAMSYGGMKGAVIGALLGPFITYWQKSNMNSVQIYDKIYRLRFDNTALWADRTAVLSGTVGALTNGQLGFVVGVDLAYVIGYISSRFSKGLEL